MCIFSLDKMFEFDKALMTLQNKQPLRLNVYNFEQLIGLLQKIYSLRTKKQISPKTIKEKISNFGNIRYSGLSSNDLIDYLDNLEMENIFIFDLETGECYQSISGNGSKIFMTHLPEKFYGKLKIFSHLQEIWRVQKPTREVILHLNKLEKNIRLSSEGTSSLLFIDIILK